jgi:hypothetical protein
VESDSALSSILMSGLFDLGFYNVQSSTPFKKRRDAVRHYIAEGESAGLNPNPFFDVEWYRSTYPDVVSEGRNALFDFLSRAPEYERNPSQGFDCGWYLLQYPDVAAAGVNPLRHFMSDGHREGRIPSPLNIAVQAPVRNFNLTRAATPQEGETELCGRFDVAPVPDAQRNAGVWDAAATDKQDFVPGSRAECFPPRPYTAVFHDVGIVGGTRLVITNTNTVFSDEIATFWEAPGWCVRPHGYKIDGSGKLSVALHRRYPSHIERGAHLMHEYASNYFHMITELLPRLIAAEDAGLDPDLPLLIQEGLHPNLLELLGIINQRSRPLVALRNRQIYTVNELHFISDVASIQDVYERPRHSEETVLHRGLTRRLADRVIAALDPGEPPQRSRRLYVRRGSRYRGLLNEQAVEEMLIREGFEVVLMDGLSVAAQIALFRQARLVVAPTGAAVTNILWCQPDTPICVLSAKHDAMPVEIWVQLGEIAGCMVTSMRCKRAFDRDDIYSIHDNYTVDLEELKQTIRGLEA